MRAWAADELGLELAQVSRRSRRQPQPTASPRGASTEDTSLSDGQFELLWEVSRQPRLVDHLDGRTLRSLVARGLARREGAWLYGTAAAHSALRTHLQSLATSSRGRTAAIYRALLNLETSVVPGSEVRLGRAIVLADDIVLGIFRMARTLDRGRG